MRKQVKGRKFHRRMDSRRALLKSLARALILNFRITTTEAKAKELSTFIEKKITRAKKGDINSRRLLSRYFSPRLVKKIVEEIAPTFKDKRGGYTRIVRLGPRRSDGAQMSIIELVGLTKAKAVKKKAPKKAQKAKK